MTVMLYERRCSKTKNWSTGLHLLINALGTVILRSSNWCAQFLGAPRREDLDRAHAWRSWLDIGIPSVRNSMALGDEEYNLGRSDVVDYSDSCIICLSNPHRFHINRVSKLAGRPYSLGGSKMGSHCSYQQLNHHLHEIIIHGCSIPVSECKDLDHWKQLAWFDVPPKLELFQKYLDISDWKLRYGLKN